MSRAYKWQFHFNAMHNLTPEAEEGKHAHSFLVILWMVVTELNMEKQNSCEGELKKYLAQYNGKYLNELKVFQGKIPTVEVICETLYHDTERIAVSHGMEQIQIEVGDSPISLFALGKKLLLGDTCHFVSEAEYERYKMQLEQDNRKAMV